MVVVVSTCSLRRRNYRMLGQVENAIYGPSSPSKVPTPQSGVPTGVEDCG